MYCEVEVVRMNYHDSVFWSGCAVIMLQVLGVVEWRWSVSVIIIVCCGMEVL
jgi:hypothetical protein